MGYCQNNRTEVPTATLNITSPQSNLISQSSNRKETVKKFIVNQSENEENNNSPVSNKNNFIDQLLKNHEHDNYSVYSNKSSGSNCSNNNQLLLNQSPQRLNRKSATFNSSKRIDRKHLLSSRTIKKLEEVINLIPVFLKSSRNFIIY